VENLSLYTISFAGLSTGTHTFDFLVQDDFFSERGSASFTESKIDVKVIMDKMEGMLTLNIEIKGKVKVLCDRCAENFFLPIKGNNKLIYKVGGGLPEQSGDDDEIIQIGANEGEIDLAPHIYDFINLLVPMKIVHPDNAKGDMSCDPEMIELIEKLSQKNKETVEEIDPRWEILKKLKQNN